METNTNYIYVILAAIVLVVLVLLYVQRRRKSGGGGHRLRPAGADGHTHSLAAVPGVSSESHGHRHYVDVQGRDVGVVAPADHTHAVEGAGDHDYAGGLATFMGGYGYDDADADLPATTTGGADCDYEYAYDGGAAASGGLAGFFGGAPGACSCQPADED